MNCQDYRHNYNACMYEDYENEGAQGHSNHLQMSFVEGTLGYGATQAAVKLAVPSVGLCGSESVQNRRNGAKEQPSSTSVTVLKKAKTAGKSNYKHVPHRDKPPHLVERRNARERRRVQAVNSAFARLRKSVPLENRNKRLSKVKTLQKAIEYINYLQQVLEDDLNASSEQLERIQVSTTLNKENSENSRWIPLDSGCWNKPPQCISAYQDTFLPI